MRKTAFAALLLLSACGEPETSPNGTREVVESEAPAGVEKINCAVEGASAFERACGVERTSGPNGLVLTVRHPSGGFRRLQVTKDGRGVIPADGAESAAVRILDDRHIEVAIGADRYQLPATVGK
jgi:hypothetical protein